MGNSAHNERIDEEDSNTYKNSNANMVQWRGNLVSEKEAKALRHVFDNLQDHFGHQRSDPRVRFNVSLAHPGRGQNWSGDMEFTYDISGDECKLGYIGLDACFDLKPKLVHQHGMQPLENYGKTFVYVYLPHSTIDKFKTYVKNGTGWDVSDEGFIHDPNRDLVAIEAKLHHQSGDPKPSFWALKEKDASFGRIGSVQEVFAQSHQQHVHRGVGIFSVSMEVEGTPNFRPTSPASNEVEAKLSFTLVSARTWGVTDCVAPIVYAPSKWH